MLYDEKDTVLRMVKMLGQLWQRLMGMLDDVEARGELERAYRNLCGLTRTGAEELDVESLRALLSPEQQMLLSELTYLRAVRFGEGIGATEQMALYRRSLDLLSGIEDEEIAVIRVKRVMDLLALCEDHLSLLEILACLRFLTLGGAYCEAEDLLFAELGRWPREQAPDTLVEAGLAFYADLSKLSDQKLEAGNLPRPELAQGLAELRTYQKNGG